MSGYLLATGECFLCRGLFAFNPELVPSVIVHDTRRPLCLRCVTTANPHRVANGLAPIGVLPGAYQAEEVA